MDPLTGVRIVAALWVVVFHISGNLYTEFGEGVRRWLGPILDNGGLGVDLFYVLSGYVLVLNYGRRMGPRQELSSTLRFYWARLARVWPAYFFTLMLAGLWHGWLNATSRFDPVAVRDYSPSSFIRQALLVVQWTEPDQDRLTWNGPAWSVSAEAFAYVLFPVVVLLIWRTALVLSGRALLLASLLSVSPLVLLIAALETLYAPWMWVLRIMCGFVAGALICAGLPHLDQSRLGRWAEGLAWMTPIAIVAVLYGADARGLGHIAPALVIPLFLVLVGALGVARRGPAALLGARPMVVGGMISYSVYLIHMPIIEVIWYLQNVDPVWAAGGTASKVAFLLVPLVVTLAGWALWRFLEEPARRLMKRMAVGRVPTDAASAEPAGAMTPPPPGSLVEPSHAR